MNGEVMKPNRQLATLLRQTAQRIQFQHLWIVDLEYKWHDSTRCNCGLLVREALGLDAHQLRQYIYRGTWQSSAKSLYRQGTYPFQTQDKRCSVTGIQLDFIFKKMYELGLDKAEDFEHLEYLSHPVIRDRLAAQGHDQIHYFYAPHVVLYLLELAEWIDEQLDLQDYLDACPKEVYLLGYGQLANGYY
jgi:hypothetical protein